MNAGVVFAEQFDLQPGIHLSAEQMLALTTDIVWLELETVTLADGSSHDVLVPKVYALVQEGDIDGQGALFSGENVRFDGDHLVNSGTIVANNGLMMNQRQVDDVFGRVQANTIDVVTSGDINLTSSDWRAQERLNLNAGRDLNIERYTEDFNRNGSNRTLAGDATRLSVTGENGSLNLRVDRDLTLRGSQVRNEGRGDTTISSGVILHAKLDHL